MQYLKKDTPAMNYYLSKWKFKTFSTGRSKAFIKKNFFKGKKKAIPSFSPLSLGILISTQSFPTWQKQQTSIIQKILYVRWKLGKDSPSLSLPSFPSWLLLSYQCLLCDITFQYPHYSFHIMMGGGYLELFFLVVFFPLTTNLHFPK